MRSGDEDTVAASTVANQTYTARARTGTSSAFALTPCDHLTSYEMTSMVLAMTEQANPKPPQPSPSD